MDKLDKLEKDLNILSKNLESHTNDLYEIKFILKELKLIDKFTDEKIQRAIENLDKLNSYKEEFIKNKDNEANKFKWLIISSSASIIMAYIIYILKR